MYSKLTLLSFHSGLRLPASAPLSNITIIEIENYMQAREEPIPDVGAIERSACAY